MLADSQNIDSSVSSQPRSAWAEAWHLWKVALLSKIASSSRKTATRRSHAYREQKRRAEGEGGGDEGGDERPGDCPMQERAGRAENGVRATPGDVAPHPAHQDQMREEYHGKPQPQRAGRPGKSAADSVESVESNQPRRYLPGCPKAWMD